MLHPDVKTGAMATLGNSLPGLAGKCHRVRLPNTHRLGCQPRSPELRKDQTRKRQAWQTSLATDEFGFVCHPTPFTIHQKHGNTWENVEKRGWPGHLVAGSQSDKKPRLPRPTTTKSREPPHTVPRATASGRGIIHGVGRHLVPDAENKRLSENPVALVERPADARVPRRRQRVFG